MYISTLTLRNFRNFINSTFVFRQGVNTILGENASGKTNAFYAMRLLLDDSLPLRARFLNERDFNRSIGDWRGHWLVISIELQDLSTTEVEQVLLCHGIAHMDGEAESGKYSLVFRPKKHVRTDLFEISRDENAVLAERLKQITIEDYESVQLCRSTVDFSDDDTYTRYVGDFANGVLPDPDNESMEELGVPAPAALSLPREVSCTFVKALRNVVEEIRKPYKNPLTSLLRGAESTIEPADGEAITERILDLNERISDLSEVRRVSDGISESLKSAVGLTYAPGLTIESELPSDLERLFRSLTLWASDTQESQKGKMYELSLGGANLIYLSMKLLEYELKRSADRIAHFLLIEEPEAHIHTHVQKTLFRRVGVKRAQVFISTHSTHISETSRISRVNVLCREPGRTEVYQPSSGLTNPEISAIERYLDAVRSTLLFAKGVILVEGEAELILLPAMFRAVFGIELDEIGISVISMSSTVFTHVALVFDDLRIRRPCAIITDADLSVVPLDHEEEDDGPFQRHCRHSQKQGELRRKKLDKVCEGSPWLEPSYSKYTFEVDLLLANNHKLFEGALPAIFAISQARARSKVKLRSPNVAVSGREVIRLAEKSGKGWFSLLLSSLVEWDTGVPDYLLGAIAFAAKKQLTDEVCLTLIRHRLAVSGKEQPYRSLFGRLQEHSKPRNPKEVVRLYVEAIPSIDPLVRLIGLRDSL